MEPLSDDDVVTAITVFGARIRGESVAADTPELATDLQQRWDAEGHAPDSRLRRSVRLVRRIARSARSRLRRS